MAEPRCASCGAEWDPYMLRCDKCGAAAWTPAPSQMDIPPAGDLQGAGATTLLAQAPRRHRDVPAPVGLAWVIAVMPVVLLAASALLGIWPALLTVAGHVIVGLLLMAYDSRRLDRELFDVPWFWGLLTPATYLIVRVRRTGRGVAAAAVGAAATFVWVSALVLALAVSVYNSAPATRLRLTPEIERAMQASDEFRAASFAWMQTQDKSQDANITEAAGAYAMALEALADDLARQPVPEDVGQERDALVLALKSVAEEAHQMELADGWVDISHEGCDVSVESVESMTALVGFATAIGDPSAGTLGDAVPQVEVSAKYCQILDPFVDTMKVFIQGVRTNTIPGLIHGYSSLGKGARDVATAIRNADWPSSLQAAAQNLASQYEAVSRSAGSVVRAIRDGDAPASTAAARDTVKSLRSTGRSEVAFAQAWMSGLEASSS